MIFLVAILTVVLIVAVIALVSAPVRSARGPGGIAAAGGMGAGSEAEEGEGSGRVSAASAHAAALEIETARVRADLEAARETKYREIRDAELDYRTGKLSLEDYQAIDADLRAEAIAILDRLDLLEPGVDSPGDATPKGA
jgi:hypothetical protein